MFTKATIKDARTFEQAKSEAPAAPGYTLMYFSCPLCGARVNTKTGTGGDCSNHSALKIDDKHGTTSGADSILKDAKTLEPANASEKTLTLSWSVTPHTGVATLRHTSFVPVVKVNGGYKHDWELYDQIKNGNVHYPIAMPAGAITSAT